MSLEILLKENKYGDLPCLRKAIERVQALLLKEESLQDYDQIHSAKSVLYAAIEQVGMRGERIFMIQRMLRELMVILTSQYQSPGFDKEVGLQIVQELVERVNKL